MALDNDFDPPELRATLVGRGIALAGWHPHLLQPAGPIASVLARGYCRPVFDLRVHREERAGIPTATELIAVNVTPERPNARQAVVAWATSLCYRRVWFEDDVIELPATLLPQGIWTTACRTCGARWSDDRPEFWASTRGVGRYPACCSLCGNGLLQPVRLE